MNFTLQIFLSNYVKAVSIILIAVLFSTLNVQADNTNAMAFIPLGTFQMGDTFGEGLSSELPLHDVYIDCFYMDKFEVSNEKMREVMQWAFDNGKITATVSTATNLEGDQQELLDLDTSDCQISFSSGIFSVDEGENKLSVRRCFLVRLACLL